MSALPRSFARLLLLPLLTLTAPARAADSGASEWRAGGLSAARLIAAGGLAHGIYRAAAEVALKGGAHTYWRNPGDAGTPPVFDFAGSVNVAAAHPLYPAPRRIIEDGAEVFGYQRGVTFPIEVTPRDPARPVELALDLHYAACARICTPARAQVRLALSPTDAPTAFAASIAAAAAQVPTPGGAPPHAARAEHAAKPTWRLAFDPPAAAGADLFAEAPEGWYFSTKRGQDGFDLTLEQKPDDAGAAARVSLTLVDGDAARQTQINLDVDAPTP